MDTNAEITQPTQKVFALPELLECILVHLSHLQPLPALQLYVLQRLNRTFQETIQRSIGIQERMQLAHIAESDPYTHGEDLAPIRWLSSRLPNTIPPIKTIDAFWPNHIGATLQQLSIDVPTAGQPRPNEDAIARFKTPDDALWRKMKLASLPLTGEIFLDVQLNDSHARLTDGRDCSITRLQITAETLGEVFDVLEGIRARSPEEHVAWERRPKMGVVNPPNVKEIFIMEDLF
ncbi:hypothetical protein Q7P37_000532 [Cladosporium fusiforme]